MKLTGAAILVSRGMKVFQAAPAAYLLSFGDGVNGTDSAVMTASPLGSFRLGEQIGGWAVFAEITLSIRRRADQDPLVTLDSGIHVDPWRCDLSAIGFGAAYAIDFLKGSQSDGIVVHTLHMNPVDTTPMALAFATCDAVFKCFDASPDNGPYFDRAAKSIVFPCRTSRPT